MTKIASILLAILGLVSSATGQINVNIYLANGDTVVLDMNSVDSIYYTSVSTQLSVTTAGPNVISSDAALIEGIVQVDSALICIDRGVCWSSTPNPTVADFTSSVGADFGTFDAVANNLVPNSTYYTKAYIQTVLGLVYGNEISFTTADALYPAGNGVTDIDGNTYPTIILGSQEWMAQNLRVESYPVPDSSGNPIPLSSSSFFGMNWYYEEPFLIDPSEPATLNHGLLYDFSVVEDQEVCPVGWHVPNDVEWEMLRDYLDPGANVNSNIAGGYMKAISTSVESTSGPTWNQPNVGANNQSGFNGYPNLSFQSQGGFLGGIYANDCFPQKCSSWFSIDSEGGIFNPGTASIWMLSNENTSLTKSSAYIDAATTGAPWDEYHAIRCVKD